MPEKRHTLDELKMRGDFIRRHIGPGESQVQEMLAAMGLSSMDELIDKSVPADIRLAEPLQLGSPMSERMTLSTLRGMAGRNRVFVSMMGMGYHGTVTPTVILRNVLENPGWYTAYSPYQAEVSQGRLEVLLTFQQVVMDLTGMELANASLLDEATAAAEAMAMAKRVTKNKSDTFFVDADCHPQTIEVIKTRAKHFDFEVVVGDPYGDELKNTDFFAVLVQYPGSTGDLKDISGIAEVAHEKKALAIAASDLLALCLIKPPGEMDFDVVIGSAQRFGVPMGYGGPHAAFMAARDAYKRQVPGRIIGVSVDSQGKPAYRMALQTREQHIRREKATSNICTAQVLLAIIAALYAVFHGPEGLKLIAGRVHRIATIVAEGLKRLGFNVVNDGAFDTLRVRVPGQAERIAAKARESRINLRVIDRDHLGITFDETTKRQNVQALWRVFSSKADKLLDIQALDEEVTDAIPISLQRQSSFLEHPVFELYHAETEMLRYLRRLSSKDLTLDRAMIPLGSCTMKLNATTEMIPITWRDFSFMHPFAPLDQAQGYQQLFEELEEMLCAVTGFDAVSLQPNAGSQGEYAGLLVIKKYHASRGEAHRNICLIPSSAHGTNPASAILAGLKVVVVGCDEYGNVDVDDLKAKVEQHAENLAALMITYPSTHGVFEAAIREICEIIHAGGGQVYLDGANLNAMLGLVLPGKIGADVSHMNLHKTFCIPHGGGGPGVGPIGVLEHLAPFLPDHPVVDGVNPASGGAPTIGAVAAAPWGSASILPITWAYIAMMGAEGLKRATEAAILNANYMAHRLKDHYPVVYTGEHGLVAHECIVDLRPLKESCGISEDDVAKRLVDYGFHAPTMSWPVVGTFMIEPTESEAKRELDRFCDAMISIRGEVAEIERGEVDRENNVVVNAPHTSNLLTEASWERPYSKRKAFFPQGDQELYDKYWPPVGRIDNVAGDRNLVCACPPLSDYQDAAE